MEPFRLRTKTARVNWVVSVCLWVGKASPSKHIFFRPQMWQEKGILWYLRTPREIFFIWDRSSRSPAPLNVAREWTALPFLQTCNKSDGWTRRIALIGPSSPVTIASRSSLCHSPSCKCCLAELKREQGTEYKRTQGSQEGGQGEHSGRVGGGLRLSPSTE